MVKRFECSERSQQIKEVEEREDVEEGLLILSGLSLWVDTLHHKDRIGNAEHHFFLSEFPLESTSIVSRKLISKPLLLCASFIEFCSIEFE